MDNILKVDYLGNLNVSTNDIISASECCGKIDNIDVMKYTVDDKSLYFCERNNNFIAFVLLHGNRIDAMNIFSKKKDYIYALLNFIVIIKNIRVFISTNEDLIPYGLDYLIELYGLNLIQDEKKVDNFNLLKQIESNNETIFYLKEISSEWRNKLEKQQTALIYYTSFRTKERDVSDFRIHRFNSMSKYRQWMMSPKDNKKGMTRKHVSRYQSIIDGTNMIKNTEVDKLNNMLQSVDERKNLTIEVGKQLSIINTTAVADDDSPFIEVSGFIEPKMISKINYTVYDEIDSIEFEDNSMFPEAAEFTFVSGKNITTTAFFVNEISVKRAYTALWMMLNRMEGSGWKIENYMR